MLGNVCIFQKKMPPLQNVLKPQAFYNNLNAGYAIAIEMKRIILTATWVASAIFATAQSGTNSPYSQYGFGTLADQSNGFNRGMNGLGVAYREGKQINFLNPASYSAVDSLTFIFDVGLSGQITNFEENGKKLNANNANFEYAMGAFRAFKHVGMSFGVVPFSNVGYSYSVTNNVGDTRSTTYTNTYNGSGGLHQAFVGIGWELFKGFSVGANGSYLWGSFDKSVVNNYSDPYVNTLSKYYSTEITSYKVDLGVQAAIPLSKKSNVTLGATYSLPHNLGADPQCLVISNNSQTGVADTASYVVRDGLKLPATISGGVMLNLNNKLRIGADYQLQKWAEVGFPEYNVNNGVSSYANNEKYFDDRQKFTLGGEYCKNVNSRKFFDRIRFRAGASYATPYYYVNGQDGPKEISVSAGLGIPINNVWNSRSLLNISGQWVRTSADGLIKENTFRINVGITFNERWFMKWKVE